jgi:hypothetical protein
LPQDRHKNGQDDRENYQERRRYDRPTSLMSLAFSGGPKTHSCILPGQATPQEISGMTSVAKRSTISGS